MIIVIWSSMLKPYDYNYITKLSSALSSNFLKCAQKNYGTVRYPV